MIQHVLFQVHLHLSVLYILQKKKKKFQIEDLNNLPVFKSSHDCTCYTQAKELEYREYDGSANRGAIYLLEKAPGGPSRLLS